MCILCVLGVPALTILTWANPNWAPSIANAQTTVHIRGTSVLHIQVRRQQGGIVVSGTLTDELEQPLSARPISAQIGNESASTRTRGNGSFDLPLEHDEATPVEFEVSFLGDRNHTGSSVRRILDMARSPVRIQYEGDGRCDLDQSEFRIPLVVKSDTSVEKLLLSVSDEFDNELSSVTTDADGKVVAVLQTSSLGSPGRFEVKVRFAGDPVRTPVELSISLQTFREAHLDLMRKGDTLVATLRDSQGGLPQKPIGLFDEDNKHLRTMLTGASGKAVFERADDLNGTLVARFEPSSDGWPRTDSNPVTLSDSVFTFVGRDLLFATAAFLVPLLCVLFIRRRGGPTPTPLKHKVTAPPGVHFNQAPKSRRAQDLLLSFHCLDSTTDDPLVAKVLLSDRDGTTQHIPTDSEGHISITLARGNYVMTVRADGYASESSPIVVPHHGEWRDASVRLSSLRELATAPFRPVATHLVQNGRFGHTTEEEVALLRPYDKALSELSEAVSEARYGPEMPTEGTVSQIDDKARRTEHLLDS